MTETFNSTMRALVEARIKVCEAQAGLYNRAFAAQDWIDEAAAFRAALSAIDRLTRELAEAKEEIGRLQSDVTEVMDANSEALTEAAAIERDYKLVADVNGDLGRDDQEVRAERDRLRGGLVFFSAIRPGAKGDAHQLYAAMDDHDRAVWDLAEQHTWSRAWNEVADKASQALAPLSPTNTGRKG